MGAVKSVRLNERYERMFSVIKEFHSHNGTKITDTEIFVNGIEVQYREIIDDINEAFIIKMKEALKKSELIQLFTSISDILEILSISEGDTLEVQFWVFLLVNSECGAIYTVDTESKERYFNNAQYEKAWKKICDVQKKDGRTEDELEDMLDEIRLIYREEFPKK